MSLLWRFLAVVAIIWAVLLPPVLTRGACTEEFDRTSAQLETDRQALGTLALAKAYLNERQVPFAVITREQCRRAKPRFLANCGDGPLVYAKFPVRSPVCRIYRDDEIRVQLQYDSRERLARTEAEMNPYKSLPLPGVTLHWAR